MIHKLIGNLLSFIYAVLFKFNWLKLFRQYDKKSKNIVWIAPRFPSGIFKYLFGMIFINDLSLIKALLDSDKKIRIVLGSKIGKIQHSTVYFSIYHHINLYHFVNFTDDILFIIKNLEAQGNTVVPNSKNAAYWENKEYMHIQFSNLGINHPQTLIVNNQNEAQIDYSSLTYPILWKDVHSSGSEGVYKMNDVQKLLDFKAEKSKIGHTTFLLQALVNMRKDLRVTIIGDKIVHHYWRVNTSKDWKPTSTAHGTNVDFVTFPEHWRAFILENFKKLDLKTGAFDITWENDDLETLPIFLEISPSYAINPNQPLECQNMSYSQYKKSYFVKNPYFKTKVDTAFLFRRKILDAYHQA